ncbi:MAG TPA: protein kinase, partial [Nannocystaceae bacterium]|nr:protein kinase [Nannocystaceae bacterium]
MGADETTERTLAGESCPDVDAIMAYVEGALEAEERDRIDAHIDVCSACAALVAHAVREADAAASGAEETPFDPFVPWPARRVPSRVGRYVVLECIGRGGMGIVCAAYDPRLRRNVAVKLLRPDRNDPDASTRLRREARALATLSHPNVVAVFECGVLDDREGNYVVMELVAGETMRRWCDRTKPSASEIVAAYLAAARGLAAAHAAGLVHRDFKPDNVLVGTDGRVCVTDFGLARVVSVPTGRSAGDSTSSSRGSSASDDAGTPTYMAPEQR